MRFRSESLALRLALRQAPLLGPCARVRNVVVAKIGLASGRPSGVKEGGKKGAGIVKRPEVGVRRGTEYDMANEADTPIAA